ncbi:lipocalin-like domain-containing protein [Parachitinimonas caeni]|uniref:Lipocalin-like domain-containing protein n=1 Tax=Parachitinimonas caeni TaxID=3031301 RepID=A0ABT7E083_9NEIS|nr:lipocalin-like domain-containing protein [Parachitinimonas caeni]MDK2124840.1 lipocalin-like domain-containing protein [Parachitinimonas caeni]
MHLSLTRIALLAALSTTASAWADDKTAIQGIWKLAAYEVEVQSSGEKFPPMGKNPSGYAIFTPQERVSFILTGDGRKAGKTAEEKAALLDTLVAYSGKYRIEGDKWITKVEVAWNPEWVGTEQSRTFKITDNRLQVLTPWRVMPNWADKGMTRSIVTFERSN